MIDFKMERKAGKFKNSSREKKDQKILGFHNELLKVIFIKRKNTLFIILIIIEKWIIFKIFT